MCPCQGPFTEKRCRSIDRSAFLLMSVLFPARAPGQVVREYSCRV
jgi:hypothetical protein